MRRARDRGAAAAAGVAAAAILACAAACGPRSDDLTRLAVELDRATAAAAAVPRSAPQAGPGFVLTGLLDLGEPSPGPGAAARALDVPGGLAVVAGDVYASGRGAVYAIASGRATPVAEVDAASGGEGLPLVLAASPGGAVYAASPDGGRLFRVDVRGGRSQQLAAGLARPAAIVALADGSVVALETAAGRLTRVEPLAGAMQTIASGLSQPTGLAAHAGRFLVGEAAGGLVLSVRPGARPVVVASGLAAISGLAADRAGRLVLADAALGSVLRVEADASRTVLASGLALRKLVGGRPVPVALAVDAEGAVLVAAPGDGGIWRIVAEP